MQAILHGKDHAMPHIPISLDVRRHEEEHPITYTLCVIDGCHEYTCFCKFLSPLQSCHSLCIHNSRTNSSRGIFGQIIFYCAIAIYHIWVYHNGYAFTMNEMHDPYSGQPIQWANQFRCQDGTQQPTTTRLPCLSVLDSLIWQTGKPTWKKMGSPLSRIRMRLWCEDRWRGVVKIVPVGDQQMNQHLIGKPVCTSTTQFISALTMRAKEPFITIPIPSWFY